MEQTDPVEYTAATVRAELARRQISGRKLADDLGWPISTTSRRLKGTYPFTIPELVAVADYLALPLTDLLPDGQAAA